MKTIGTNTTKLTGTEPREGELLITKIQRAKRQGELIKDVAEIIYKPQLKKHHPRANQQHNGCRLS